MRTFWNVVSFLAVAHLLAVAMFVGWLWQSGRLNRERIDGVRATFSRTIEQELADEKTAAQEAEREHLAEVEEMKRRRPALPANEQIRLTGMAEEQTEHTERRMADLRDLLAGEIERNRRQLELLNQALETERKRYDQGIDDLEQRKNDAQFIKAVKLLESQPPKIAKERIVELVQSGELDRAVAYLDAMTPRAASRILSEFKEPDEGKMATELLERLRTHGVRPPSGTAEGQPSDAQPLARAP
jgi:hypothetical protein